MGMELKIQREFLQTQEGRKLSEELEVPLTFIHVTEHRFGQHRFGVGKLFGEFCNPFVILKVAGVAFGRSPNSDSVKEKI